MNTPLSLWYFAESRATTVTRRWRKRQGLFLPSRDRCEQIHAATLIEEKASSLRLRGELPGRNGGKAFDADAALAVPAYWASLVPGGPSITVVHDLGLLG
jgi:hypothetical protein